MAVMSYAGMEFKGCASLTNNNINILKNIYNGMDLRVDSINQNVGRIYVVDQGGNMQPLPIGPNGPVFTMTDRVGAAVAAHNNEFLYVYGDSFTVYINGQALLKLDLQKQHSMHAPSHIQHYKIEM